MIEMTTYRKAQQFQRPQKQMLHQSIAVFDFSIEMTELAHLSLFHSVFEEPEDPSNRSFFSEIISSISDVKFSHSGRYMMTRDYLTVKIWDLNMESRPVETYQVS